MKIEMTRIHFSATFSLPSPSSDLKAPIIYTDALQIKAWLYFSLNLLSCSFFVLYLENAQSKTLLLFNLCYLLFSVSQIVTLSPKNIT